MQFSRKSWLVIDLFGMHSKSNIVKKGPKLESNMDSHKIKGFFYIYFLFYLFCFVSQSISDSSFVASFWNMFPTKRAKHNTVQLIAEKFFLSFSL